MHPRQSAGDTKVEELAVTQMCANSGSDPKTLHESTPEQTRKPASGSGRGSQMGITKRHGDIRNFATDKTECKEVHEYLQDGMAYLLPPNQFHFIRTLLVL